MGTRGTWGYIIDEQPKLTYNHFDSYPSGLGEAVLAHARRPIEELRTGARALTMVDESTNATREHIDAAKKADLHDPRVSTGQATEYYSLLRNLQGDPDAQLRFGVMIDGAGFPLDSLFCEWAYIIDLDQEVFEVYLGFQTEPHHEGRFASDEPDRDYYPVRLVATFPLSDLPESLEALDAQLAAEADA
jgi:hypothetical protein